MFITCFNSPFVPEWHPSFQNPTDLSKQLIDFGLSFATWVCPFALVLHPHASGTMDSHDLSCGAEALPSKVGETTRCIEEEKHLALCILFIGFLVKISISYTYIYYIRIRLVCILLLLPSINYLLISRTPGKCQDGDYGTVGDLFYQGFAWVWDCTLSSKQW